MTDSSPASGLTHPLVLRGHPIVTLVLGAVVALGLTLLLPALIALLVLGIAAVFRRPENISAYFSEALGYHLPEGVLATHLGLGSMILITWIMMRRVHRLGFRWTASVQPGMRWRYLIVCLLMAALVLNLILWLGPEGRGMNWQEAQPQWYVYLAIIVFSSPLQAAAEEIFFRGYLQQTIGSATGYPWLGVLVASMTFAIMHGWQNTPLLLHRFGFALIAGCLVVVTGGLEAAIAIHIVNNLMAFGYAVVSGGIAATAAVTAISWRASVFALGGFALSALLAWWIGRRMNLATLTP